MAVFGKVPRCRKVNKRMRELGYRIRCALPKGHKGKCADWDREGKLHRWEG